MKTPTPVLVLASLAGTLLAFGAAVLVGRSARADGGGASYWDDDEVEFVRRIVSADYVDDVGDKQSKDCFYGALDGYLKALPDEYDDFYPPDEYRRWREDTAGHYAGVGVRIEAEARGLKIVGVYPGGPASKGGVRVGDVVVEADGQPLAGVDTHREDTLRRLKGPAGSAVRVKLWSPEPRPAPGAVREATLVREIIRPATVFPRRLGKDGKVGYLRLTEFTEQTGDDFDRELDALLAGGAKAVVVDLRGNGGGVLPSTLRAADRFVRDGLLMRMEGRAPNSTRDEPAHAEGTIPDAVGLVVLVDGRTASASEVFAGCIQDHRRGTVLGSRTYGKFLVQNILEIPGKGAALKLTTARYQTPLGRSFQRPSKDPNGPPAGLLPDIPVEASAADRERLEWQWENAEEALWGAPAKHADVPVDWVDPPLQRALDLLDGNLILDKIRSGAKGNG